MEGFEKIEELWEAGDNKMLSRENLARESIEDIMKIQSQSISMQIIRLIRINIALAILMILIEGYNVYFYLENLKIFTFILISIVTALILIVILNQILKKTKKIDRLDTTINETVLNKMTFYRKYFYVLNHSVALIILLITCSLLLVEGSINGDFRINNKWLMTGILSCAYLLVYIINNLTLSSYLQQLNVVVNSIDKELYFRTKAHLIKIKTINTAIVIAIILLMALGVFVFLKSN